jgi:hypothetical protein
MLPIPFTNPIPTAGILLLAVATLEADGLLMCVAYGLTIAITLGSGRHWLYALAVSHFLSELVSLGFTRDTRPKQLFEMCLALNPRQAPASQSQKGQAYNRSTTFGTALQ